MTHIRDVVPSQQDLRDRLPQVREQLVPQRDKPALSNCRNRLKDTPLVSSCRHRRAEPISIYLHGRQVLGPFVQIQPPQSDADGSGGHEDDSVAVPAEPDTSLGDERKVRQQRFVCLFIADRRCACPAVVISHLPPGEVTTVRMER